MRPFRGRFFRPRGIFEKGRISGFLGDLTGFAASSGLMSAFACHAKLGALRPNDVPQLQFAASAVLALEPCFDRMTAFLLGQP